MLGAQGLHDRRPGAAFLVATAVGQRSPLARALRGMPNGSMMRLAGTPLGLADASIRGADTISRATIPPAAAGALRLQDVFDAVLYAGPADQSVEPPGAVFRAEPEYVREIRRRIGILSAFYRVDIWSEDLDRLLRSPE